MTGIHDDKTQATVHALNVEEPDPAALPAMQKLVSDRYHELGLSFRELAAKTIGDDGEPRVSHGTLSNIYRGHHKWTFSPATLEGIAIALDLRLSAVREAAGKSTEPRESLFRLPTRHNRLSPRNRKVVVRFADALLDTQDAYDETAGALDTIMTLAGGLTSSQVEDLTATLQMLAKAAPNDEETITIAREQVQALMDALKADA